MQEHNDRRSQGTADEMHALRNWPAPPDNIQIPISSLGCASNTTVAEVCCVLGLVQCSCCCPQLGLYLSQLGFQLL